METARKDIDAKSYYLGLTDPDLTFNRTEITLSHLFRSPTVALDGRSYSDGLFRFLRKQGCLRPTVLEIGGGLGDVAFNALKSPEGNTIDQYAMCDISERLLDRQRSKLNGLASDFMLGDCHSTIRRLKPLRGLVLSNGMLADLRSVYLSREDSPDKYEIDDELEDFAWSWLARNGDGYLHVGSLELIRDLSESLHVDSTVALLEYDAHSQNQPSWFDDHFECGIDFDQLIQYANRLDLEATVSSIDEILGLPPETAFLTMDMFTKQERMAQLVPSTVKLWQRAASLPVLAYTRESFHEVLQSDKFGLSTHEAQSLVQDLDPHFHSIHASEFDSKNPKTWSYKCLLLRKSPIDDWEQGVRVVGILMLSQTLQLTEEEAEKAWEEEIDPNMEPFTEFFVAGIISGVIYDLVKMYGKRAWGFFLYGAMLTKVREIHLPQGVKTRLLAATKEAVNRWKKEANTRNE